MDAWVGEWVRQGGGNGSLREETVGLHSYLEPSNFSTSAGIYPEGPFLWAHPGNQRGRA